MVTVPEVPRSAATVDLDAAQADSDRAIKNICKEVVPGWGELLEEDLAVSKISGGITNILLLVSPQGDAASRGMRLPVTVRVFGPNTDIVIDRKREWQAINLLSAAGFGAKLIGAFTNGVVQSFIHARTLEPADMAQPAIVALIASSVRRFHEVDVPGERDPQLWPTIDKFLGLASRLSFEDPAKQDRFRQVDVAEIRQEILELQGVCDKLHAPVVFAHNDLLSGNFMHNEETGRFYIIDFEYGAYSYRGYDLGNHFNEYAGFDCDYTLYPNKEGQFLFFRHYLSPGAPNKAAASELEQLYAETNCFALASHIYWGVWALVQAKYSPIDFDYLGYFFLRYAEYKRKKQENLGVARAYLRLQH